MGPWRSRGYLPHFDRPGSTQQITFRLADSLPTRLIEEWKEEAARLPESARRESFETRIGPWLDQGYGACCLREDRVAEVVEKALLHFDGERFQMIAWCIMPNHVHAVLKVLGECSLRSIVHSWKSFSAKQVNRVLGRTGKLWQTEYHDRFIRNQEHLLSSIRYVEWNPVAAGLVVRPEEWRWGSAWRRAAGEVEE